MVAVLIRNPIYATIVGLLFLFGFIISAAFGGSLVQAFSPMFYTTPWFYWMVAFLLVVIGVLI